MTRLLKNTLRTVRQFMLDRRVRTQSNALLRSQDTFAHAVGRGALEAASHSIADDERARVAPIEALRARLFDDSRQLSFTDFGARVSGTELTATEMGDGGEKTSTVAGLARGSANSAPRAMLLFKIIRHAKPATCLELGTSLGISGAYQGVALQMNGQGTMTTIEGAEAVAEVARENFAELGLDNVTCHTGRFVDVLPGVLEAIASVDYAFIDGHHEEHATWEYFNQILPHLASQAVVVFDDIDWSAGMERAWQRVAAHDDVAYTIDAGKIGVCVIKRG
jgi:predicted O-methyltransferase YrrM